MDENRDWEITDYMPNIKADMTSFVMLLKALMNGLKLIKPKRI